MSALGHKAWHDLGRMRGQAIAVAALVACAMASWVSTAVTEQAMVRTRDTYYGAQRFADVFAAARRAPDTVAGRLAAVPGVAEVETRVVWTGRLRLPDGRPARAVFASLPDGGAARLDRLWVRAGRALRPGERGAALVTEGFAQANGLAPGDDLDAVLNGRRQRLRVVGVALSPEYVYAIGPGMIFPDDRSFGVVWMARADLGPAAGLDGAFNAAALRLAPGAVEAEVIAGVDAVLDQWGGAGAYAREEQLSNRYLSNEIAELRVLAVVVPAIFMGISAFLLSVIASRLVAAQRQQVGMLKALGYGDVRIALHYLELVGAVVAVGVVAGAAIGVTLGRALARMYASLFRFPFLVYEDAPAVVLVGAALVATAALLGVVGAVGRAARLPPAEAMRPERPVTFRPGRLDRLAAFRRLPAAAKMIVRNLGRRPARTGLSIVGIATGVAVIVEGGFAGDALAYLLRLQFEQARRDDAIVVFSEASGPDAATELRAVPGVRAVERFRHVPTTLRNGAHRYRTELAGLEPGGSLWRLVDVAGHVVPVPPAGIVLSRPLARTLAVAPGDRLVIEVHEGRRPVLTMTVAAVIDDFVGVSATTSLAALDAAMGDGDLASGALVSAEPDAASRLEERLSERPRVAAVTLLADARRSMEEVVGRFMGGVVAVMAGFAVVLAGAVVYNAARVAHADRARDLATLRVLGFGVGEAWGILAGELAILVLAAIPVGAVLGWALVAASTRAMSSELFRLPVVIGGWTWARAAGLVVAAGALLVLRSRRWIAGADLVEVLKERE